MKKPNNPHDLFFKRVWSKPEVAQGFLQRYLPKAVTAELELSTLTLTKDSFIDTSLAEHYSDLLYTVNTKAGRRAYLYSLLEHKSYVSEWTGLQLLGYMVRIWEQAKAELAKPPLPAIIPLVLYHGERRWTAATEFSRLIDAPPELAAYTPTFSYQLCDLTQDQLDDFNQQAILAVALQVLKYGRSGELPQQLPAILSLFTELLTKRDEALSYLETVLRYLAHVSGELDVTTLKAALARALPSEIGETMMPTLAETWHEEGLQQGLQQGSEAHARRMLRTQLTQRFGELSDAIEQRIEQADQAQLDQWIEQVVTTPTLAALFTEKPQ